MSSPSEDVHLAVTKEMYLIWKDHQSNRNWLSNEYGWDGLHKSEKQFWLDFTQTLLKKVRLEALSSKGKPE